MRRPFSILAGMLFTLANLLTWVVLAPPPAAACSCALVAIADFKQPENQVFVGTAGALGPEGQPVAVQLWLHGTGAAPLVWLAPDSFGDGAACGTAPLPQGTRWILGTWLEAPNAQPRIGLCNPAARIDSPEGQAMLAEALTAFGAGVAPPSPTQGDTAPPVNDPPVTDPLAPALLIGTVALGVVVVGGIVLFARRRS